MQEILEINSRDLTGGELDYDVVDLEAGELNINTIDLDSGELETVTVDASRIIPLERDVAELKNRGNVRYDTAQELTEEQQTQARENIDAQESISDLDEIRSNAASGASKVSNIQSDWNATTGDAAILNKPNLSNVATSGNYNDLNNKPSIPSQLSDLSSDSIHRLVSDAEKSTWNSKQDAIDDLEDIRENASAGATALQSEEDPIFSASAASGITAEDIASWNEHTSNIGTITGVSVNGTSVATSGVANISSVPASILEGTIPNGITAITQNQGDGSNKIATTSYVDTAINNLPDPMIFRGSLGTGGTITTLPTAASTNVGYTYKVIEDGTYANQSAKIGDTFISDGSAWILIPSGDEPSGTVTSIKIEANSPIQIDNNAAISTSGTRTLSHATSGVTAGTYRTVTVNNTGHVTAGTTEAIYILTTNWNSTATQCYLRSQYFLNSLVPTQKGDLILCRGNGNLFKCGDLVYDSQEEVYYTNPTYLCNVLVAQGTSSQFVKGDGSLDNNTYAGAQTSGGAANKAVSIPFGQVDSTSTSTAFTATVDGITELRDGVCVYLKNGVVTSASGYTININNLGAKPVYQTMAAATASTTGFNINYTMLFVYNSSRVVDGCWDMFYGYYYNTDVLGYDIREYNSGSKKVKTACQRYQIMLTCMDGMLLPVYSGAYSNGTSKTLTTEKFNPLGQIYYYYSTTNLSAGGSPAAGTLVSQFTYTTVDIRYSFNTGSTLTVGNDIYLVCVPQDDGSAVLHTSPIAFSLPSTEDGLIYKRLGKAYGTYTIALEQDKPCYYYKNGAINLWTGTGTQTDVSKSTESNVIDVGEYDLMKINEVRGKSLVMNQLVQNGAVRTASGVTQSYDSTTGTMILNGTATADANFYGQSRYGAVLSTLPAGHKGLFISSFVSGTFTGAGDSRIAPSNSTDPLYFKNGYATKKQIITSSSSVYPLTNIISGDKFENVVFRQQQIDLTQMFGAGNEPTTVEEVEAILGNDYYEYNTGEVVGNNVEKLDITGFNIWNEEWEVGRIDNNTGQDSVANTNIRTKGYLEINANSSYCYTNLSSYKANIYFYDASKNFLSFINPTFTNKYKTFTTPENAAFLRLFVATDYGTTYNNDICINKSNTSKNGTYEPYKHSEFPLNLTELTGKVNGEGTSVTIFPDGLHGVGDVYDSLIVDDDGYARRAVKRMAKVDIGTFTWKTTSTESRFYASLPADATAYTAINNVFKNTYSCDKYTKSTTLTGMTDKTTFLGNNSYMYAQDSSYSTAADFKTAMDGVMLYYELATPIEYVLDTPVQCVAKVYPNGTVKQVPVMPDSTPMVMDVTYLRDTGGFIGGMMNKLASLEARIAALEGG